MDEVNKMGFSFDKDFVLKCLLVLFSRNIRFKIENFNTTNIEAFEKNWKNARRAITTAVKTIKRLGFTSKTLRSHNALIPVVYYLFNKKYSGKFETAVAYKEDRKNIAKYLHIALLTRLYGKQADSVLTALRDVLDKNSGDDAFPMAAIMTKCEEIGRSITYTDEMAKGLLRTQKDDSYAFSILALLYPNLDYNNRNYHKDHLHPYSDFNDTNLDAAGILDPEQRAFFMDSAYSNSILNLQLLSENENKQKQDMTLESWVETYCSDPVALSAHLIPANTSLAFVDFQEFIEARENLLLKQLERIWR